MAEPESLIDYVVSLIEAIDSIGNVYDHRPYKNDLQTMEAAFVDTSDNAARFWFVFEGSFAENYKTNAAFEANESIALLGFLSVVESDDTEAAQRTLIVSVRNAIRDAIAADPTLGGRCVRALPLRGQAMDFDSQTFPGVLCHRIQMEMPWMRLTQATS